MCLVKGFVFATSIVGTSFLYNYIDNLPIFSIAHGEKPLRSPLRLRFSPCTLKKIFCVIDAVITK